MYTLNQELINAIREKTPEKENAANLLMKILPLGKEAVYRRLSGKIPFTFQEAVSICRKLNISIDLLMGIERDSVYSFHINAIFEENSLRQFYKMMSEIVDTVDFIRDDPDTISYRIHNSVPSEFLFKYELLSRVSLYTFYYQAFPESTPQKLSEIEIPEEIINIMRESSELIQKVKSVVIIDKYSFPLFVDTLTYYYELGMISDDEISEIKGYLLQILDEMERIAITGKTEFDKKVDVYISHIPFDSSYTYIHSTNFEATSVRIYNINYLSSVSKEINHGQRRWIESLMRFSTLISESGELQRNQYFNAQREIVNQL